MRKLIISYDILEYNYHGAPISQGDLRYTHQIYVEALAEFGNLNPTQSEVLDSNICRIHGVQTNS